ncbi:MAG: hypothetical protein KDK51_06095, partial [Deltaproteobacteria bacterium]|nr:hypothetical protein [Deltaproteobacteria bacterium]
ATYSKGFALDALNISDADLFMQLVQEQPDFHRTSLQDEIEEMQQQVMMAGIENRRESKQLQILKNKRTEFLQNAQQAFKKKYWKKIDKSIEASKKWIVEQYEKNSRPGFSLAGENYMAPMYEIDFIIKDIKKFIWEKMFLEEIGEDPMFKERKRIPFELRDDGTCYFDASHPVITNETCELLKALSKNQESLDELYAYRDALEIIKNEIDEKEHLFEKSLKVRNQQIYQIRNKVMGNMLVHNDSTCATFMLDRR